MRPIASLRYCIDSAEWTGNWPSSHRCSWLALGLFIPSGVRASCSFVSKSLTFISLYVSSWFYHRYEGWTHWGLYLAQKYRSYFYDSFSEVINFIITQDIAFVSRYYFLGHAGHCVKINHFWSLILLLLDLLLFSRLYYKYCLKYALNYPDQINLNIIRAGVLFFVMVCINQHILAHGYNFQNDGWSELNIHSEAMEGRHWQPVLDFLFYLYCEG